MTRAKDIANIISDANFGGTLDVAGVLTGASLDISGNIDVDGVTNLDVTDIDGTLNVAGETTLQTHLNMGDGDIIKLGASADLTIQHDGSHSYVKDAGTGNLFLDSVAGSAIIRVNDGYNAVEAIGGGAVNISHNGATKISTTATGIDVTGNLDISVGQLDLDANYRVRWGASNAYSIHSDNANYIRFITADAEQVRIHSNGVLSASDGIALGVGTANTASNVLDDYEEGTFTATLEGTTTTPATALTATGSSYTKIGNIVYVTMAFVNLNTAGYAGGIKVSGLPFSVTPGNQLTGNVAVHNMATIPSGSANIAPFFQGTFVEFFVSKTNAPWLTLTHNAGTASYLYFTGVYKT